MSATEKLSTPVESDTAIAEQGLIVAKAERPVELQLRYRSGINSYRFDAADLAAAEQQLAIETSKLDKLRALYTGWTRYYHVTNNNGHVHTSMNCTSCFDTTVYGWRTDLSGLTPEEVVEREAYNACSVCMPIAPAVQQAARERYNAEQRAAKQNERQAKKDEKLRKAAERAIKLLAKVEAAVEDLGGWEVIDAMPQGDPGSLYEATYGFGAFEGRKELQTTVGDELSAQAEERRTGRRESWRGKDPREVITEAREKGLIA